MNESELRIAIRNIAAISREGLLGELEIAFAHECRKAGGLPPDEWRQRMAAMDSTVNVDEVARVASDMLGKPLAECKQLARDELYRDKFADLAMQIIADFRVQLTPHPRLPTPEDDAQWNATYGSPSVQTWEREQEAEKKARRRKW